MKPMGAILIQTFILPKLTQEFITQSLMVMTLKGQKLNPAIVFRGLGYLKMIKLGHYCGASRTFTVPVILVRKGRETLGEILCMNLL